MGGFTITSVSDHTRFYSLFSKYLNLDNIMLNNFISSIPSKFDDAISIINDTSVPYIHDEIISSRKNLKKIVYNFHDKAGTLTPSIRNQINMLDDNKVKIIVAIHQPNLFAFSGVFKKIVLLETIAKYAENLDNMILPMFLLVDHDFMDDTWLHVAKLPSMRNSSGILDIRYPMNNSRRWKITCKADPPTKSLLNYWENQIYYWIKNDKNLTSKSRQVLCSNFDKFWHLVEDSLFRCNNYSEFTSFIITKIANLQWDYKTIFANLSELSFTFKKGFEYLLLNNDVYTNTVEKSESYFRQNGIVSGISSKYNKHSPLWVHCSCGSKASSILNRTENGGLQLVGNCIRCKKTLTLPVGTQNNIDIPNDRIMDVTPRAIPILLLLARQFGISGHISGTGGSLGYTIVGKRIFDELKIDMPKIIIWPSKDTYTGFAQKEVLSFLTKNNINDVSNFLYDTHKKYIEFQNKINPLIDKRVKVYPDKTQLSELLNELFYYKQEQRKLKRLLKNVERANNALKLKPCIIDYIVNFGVENISGLWVKNLIKNNDLSLPLTFESNSYDEKY